MAETELAHNQVLRQQAALGKFISPPALDYLPRDRLGFSATGVFVLCCASTRCQSAPS